MNVLILYALIFALGAGSGSYVTHAIDVATISKLEKAIDAKVIKATNLLNEETIKVSNQAIETYKANEALETANAQHIETINSLHDKLAAIRLQPKPRKESRGSCSGPKTASYSPKKSTKETSFDEFPTRVHEFLVPRVLIADQVSEYAQNCYKFVVENNCGISKEK